MRDYRFRVWDPATETMQYNVGLHRISEFADETLVKMQMTGLKDVEGTNIYEGDILIGVSAYKHLTVTWERLGWAIQNENNHFSGWVPERHLVCGNIYETPELLKQE